MNKNTIIVIKRRGAQKKGESPRHECPGTKGISCRLLRTTTSTMAFGKWLSRDEKCCRVRSECEKLATTGVVITSQVLIKTATTSCFQQFFYPLSPHPPLFWVEKWSRSSVLGEKCSQHHFKCQLASRLEELSFICCLVTVHNALAVSGINA